jgi:phosphoglycerate kinase
LENLRFFPGEEENSPEFTEKLSLLADFYINEAFSVSHRKHASIVGLPTKLSSAAGFHFKKEVENLSKSIDNPPRPVVFIIGGAKPETKLPLVYKLAEKADWVLVGGTLAGEEKGVKGNIVFTDLKESGLDITSESAKMFSGIISRAKTIVWNGPMGKYEEEESTEGTREVALAISAANAFKIVGGGDTIASLTKFKLIDKMDYVSTAGGAMLEYLANGSLPGIEALEKTQHD